LLPSCKALLSHFRSRNSNEEEAKIPSTLLICHVVNGYRRGLIGIRIYWTLTHVSASSYNSLTKMQTPKIIVNTAHIKYSVFTSRCLVATSKGGRSRSSGFPNCPRPQLPASHFSQLATADRTERFSLILGAFT
jgi:hypothetical protein